MFSEKTSLLQLPRLVLSFITIYFPVLLYSLEEDKARVNLSGSVLQIEFTK
jgi:hypothetical protein